jgi:hypothetical protein
MDGIKLDLIETKAEGPVADVREDAYHKLNRTQRDDKRGRMRIKYMCIDLGKYKDPKGRRGELLHPAVELVYWRFSTAMLTALEEWSRAVNRVLHYSTECLLPKSAVSDEEERSASISKKSPEKENENSSAKENDKELDGTTLEHNHDPGENIEEKQDLPKRRCIPRDYEQAIACAITTHMPVQP